jgi:hypothetical protein
MRFRALSILGLLGWALPSLAGTLPCQTPFNPAVDSDALAVCDPGGKLYDYVSVTEANEDPSVIYRLTIAAPDSSQYGFATTFCEFAAPAPCGPGLSQEYYSDIVGVASDGSNYFLGFSSDAESGTPYGSQGYYFIQPEPIGWYNVTMYLDPGLRASGFTAWFVSEVPEPGSVVLLVTGIAMLGFGSRRKRLAATRTK